jgi:hypothetical protein
MTVEADRHEVALDLWLQAEPNPAELEQEVRDRGGYDYPVPADDRG